MTTPAISTESAPRAWDEPEGLAARGTAIVLTGRGETPAAYQRFGRRIAADAYRVRVVETDPYDAGAARDEVKRLLADDDLPAPKVLVGADTGATLAAGLADELDGVDAVVLAGLALPGGAVVASWDEELEARTACPTHRRVLSEDAGFARGGLARPLPAERAVRAPATPALVIHGSADRVTSPEPVFALFRGVTTARVRVVEGGRHDVLNDVSHRSVAATVVLFLESLKLGADLPDIVSVPA